MDSTTRFFTKLRKLAVTLESETAKLQHSFENRNNDDGDSAMRAYHELNCEVGDLKGQIQSQLAQQKAQVNEVSSFIKACRVMEQKVTQDIQVLKGCWEKYGYDAPKDAQRPSSKCSLKSEGEEGSGEEAGDDQSSSPVKVGPPPFADVLRTPQLSDFGLSEMQLKRALAGAEWCSEVPPMPEMSLPHPSLNTPAPPPMPLTPKCALRMDDDELQTPQMHDFGISEHTMCLNNDFTMDLLRKNVEKPQSLQTKGRKMPQLQSLTLPLFILRRVSYISENLESPKPPVFCTPGFKIKKTNSHCSPPAQVSGDPESPVCPGHLPTTPEVPAFQTPYLNRLSAQQPEPITMDADDDNHTFKLPTPTHNGAASSKRSWEYNVPEMSIMGVEDKQMPEMPNLESFLGNSLQTVRPKERLVTKEPTVNRLELDGPTQEFSLGTPRIRMAYEEPSTPEMPDLSSVTQDICKVSCSFRLKADLTAKKTCSVVSEFQSLPSYLRQMTLYNLNQVVHNINKFTAKFHGQCRRGKTELQMEDLKRITNLGTKTPIYILCLAELKRLEQVGGARDTSVYKLSTHT
uniref:Spindle and kinetochore associated complex subunit 3 n=1 Tax=Seriola lalandi dorsalis TaxID=1841481 RepID=A0A3B4XZE9_SERLL